MKWSILTDTHNKLKIVKEAIAICEREKCSHMFHCGDFETNKILELFLDRPFKFHYVTDHDGRHDRRLSKKYRKDFLIKTISGTRVALYHSTYSECDRRTGGRMEKFSVRQAINSKAYDFVFHGHLHYFNLKLPSPQNSTVVLNSGGFYHKNLSTFCMLDLEAGFLDLYYWLNSHFVPILRFPLNKSFEDIGVLDPKAAFEYAQNLGELRWSVYDRCGYTFTIDEDCFWLNKNFEILFKKVGYDNRPGFFFMVRHSKLKALTSLILPKLVLSVNGIIWIGYDHFYELI